MRNVTNKSTCKSELNDLVGLYSIGTVAEILSVHPETLRVWERNGLIHLNRTGFQRKYSNTDLKKLKFIHQLIDEKGLNLAGVRFVLSMYSCWEQDSCPGGKPIDEGNQINVNRPCWKHSDTYCWVPDDLTDCCSLCNHCSNTPKQIK